MTAERSSRTPAGEVHRQVGRRVLFITPMAEAGGSDHALLRMASQMAADGFICRVVVPALSPLEAEFSRAGVAVSVIHMRRITTAGGLLWWVRYALEWPVAVARLCRVARRHRADVIASNSLHSWYGWAVAALLRRPHVWHAREIVMQSQAALRLERRLVGRFADLLIACSEAVAEQFRTVLPQERICVVHEDVDRAVFHPEPDGTADGTALPAVGFVGRIDTWKGVDVLLEAWPAVHGSDADAQLLVAGPPVEGKEWYYEELEARTQGMAGVTWLGPVGPDQAAAVFRQLHVLAAPSTLPEPYGLVVVEALASGSRVVVTDFGGAPEIVARAERGAGIAIPPNDPKALAAAITTLMAAGRDQERHSLIAPFPFDWGTLYATSVRRWKRS